MTSALAWKKQGLIFTPDPSRAWMRSHAAVPVPLHMDGDRYRVFFSSRDAGNRSHVGYFDIDLADEPRVIGTSPMPVLAPGPLGCYNGDGVYAESAIKVGDEIRLYTIGVTTGHTRPLFYAAIGVAVSTDGGNSFTTAGTPIMDISPFDPCLVTAPFVLREGDRWRMWYASGIKWAHEPQGLQSYYHIKYAESRDGLDWRRDGRVCVDFADARERCIARLWVVRDGGRYRGWFSVNDGIRGYRIGYAESADGLQWTRRDDLAGIAPSDAGWDSEAQAYPAVVRHADRWFMFYNGNAFGRDGIGLAIAPA
jgi:predicted GH43/DUF377 family glycosyl hydrolase